MRVFKYINRVFSIVLDIVFILLLVSVYRMGLIPVKYLVILSILVVVLGVFFTIFSFKVKRLVLSIILLVFMLLFGTLSFIGIYYVWTTSSFFDTIEEVKEKKIYYVVVKKDSKYKELDDLDKKSMAIFENQSNNYKKVLEEVRDSITIHDKEYTNMNTIVKDLLNGDVDSLLINSTNKEILDENMDSFQSNTRVIAELSIDVIQKKEKEEEKKYGSMNILISGIDTNGHIDSVSRSDVNIVVTINPYTHEVLLTNIPRDMYVQLHGTTGLKDKLTHAGIYGIDMSINTIEDFLEIDIPYYIRVNFDSVIKLVDTIGGVDVNNDVAFQGRTRYFEKGMIHLNGKEALEYARERKKMPNGDNTRGEHQERIIEAIITKISSSKELLKDYGNILDDLKDLFQTNIPTDTIKKYVRDQIDTMSKWNVHREAVTGTAASSYRETYSMPGMRLYVTIPDEESRKDASNRINELLEKVSNEKD